MFKREGVHNQNREPRYKPGKLAQAVSRIPHAHIKAMGRLLGTLAYILDKRHKRIVFRNLKFTHPHWTSDRIRRLSIGVFRNTAITVLEICQMHCLSKTDILGRVRIKGEENLREALNGTKGVILISGHLGNWEIGVLCTAGLIQRPLVAPARPLRPGILDRWMRNSRTRFGTVILDKKRALSSMAGMLRKGSALGLLIDQGTVREEGVEVEFFDRTVTATPAAALLARRYGCPVLPVFCVREPDGRLTLLIEPPLTLQRTRDSRLDLQANTQIMTLAIENMVRSYPDQWFWFHKRWKRHYPYLYPEDRAKRLRRREKKVKKKLKKMEQG